MKKFIIKLVTIICITILLALIIIKGELLVILAMLILGYMIMALKD